MNQDSNAAQGGTPQGEEVPGSEVLEEQPQDPQGPHIPPPPHPQALQSYQAQGEQPHYILPSQQSMQPKKMPVWGWVLIGLGVFLLLICMVNILVLTYLGQQVNSTFSKIGSSMVP